MLVSDIVSSMPLDLHQRNNAAVCGLSVQSGCSRRLRWPSAPAALVAINPLVLVEENLLKAQMRAHAIPHGQGARASQLRDEAQTEAEEV